MKIDIWSDVVCPWCYIGKRRFDQALVNLRSGSEIGDPIEDVVDSIEISYRAFQLDPQAPVGDVTPVREVYARKFGGPDRARAIFAHLTEAAAHDNIEFAFDIALRANTVNAHRLLWRARVRYGYAVQAALKESLMAAYFTNGENIGDPEVLARTVSEVWPDDVDVDDVRSFLERGEGRDEVVQDLAEAATRGITGVPTYLIDGQWAIPGAQDTDTFERVLRRVLTRQQ